MLYGKGQGYIFWLITLQLFVPSPFAQKIIFSLLAPFIKKIDHICRWFLESVLFHWSFCLSLFQYHDSLDYYSFHKSWNKMQVFQLCSVLKHLTILGPSHFHMNFRNRFSTSRKSLPWIWSGIALSVDQFGENWHLTNA